MSKNNNIDFISFDYKNNIKFAIVYFIVFFVVAAVTFFIGYEINSHLRGYIIALAVGTMIAGIVIFIINIISCSKKKSKLTGYIESFSFSTENTARAAILSYPDPIVIVTTNGLIKWYNPAFSEMCGRGKLFETRIQEIFPSIRLSVFVESGRMCQDFSYGGRDFILTGEVSETRNNDDSIKMIGLSFSDISEITRLNKKIEEERCVVCSAVIDNYDEVFKETPNSNHGTLLGDIERCISEWVEKGQGFYRKYDRDRFIILFEAAKFEILKEERFSVLDEVKKIDQHNKIPVTLSIGVGAVEDDIRENDRLSVVALDMALGRGGDQAVMKTDGGYVFFGAKSLGIEKTTKVKARVVAKSLAALIDKSSNVMIMGHKNSDFDSFGATIGLFRAVMQRERNAFIVMDRVHNNVGDLLKPLLAQDDYSSRIISYERAVAISDENTLLIVVDTHRPGMVEYPELLTRINRVALIDHHRRSEEFIENAELTYHEPYASSACEMVTEILQYINDKQTLSVQEAEALYCGIYLDTKAFTFKTGARTFEAAAYLRKIGVDPIGVHRMFRNDLDMYILKSKVISGAKVYRNNVAIAICEEPSKNIQLVVAQAADELLNINGIEASFVLARVSNRVIISGRSLGAVNVQVILEKLGGGGHITIAGAQLENSSLTIAELKLQNAIDEVMFD